MKSIPTVICLFGGLPGAKKAPRRFSLIAGTAPASYQSGSPLNELQRQAQRLIQRISQEHFVGQRKASRG